MRQLPLLAALLGLACSSSSNTAMCTADTECEAPLICLNGACTSPCNSDGDCGPDQVCDAGICENSPFIRCVGGGSNCAAQATCTTIGGEDFCVCNNGFDGNGSICNPIQCGNAECETGEDCFLCSQDCGTCDADCIDGRCTIEELVLYDADSDTALRTISNGEMIDQTVDPLINILVATRPSVIGCVTFTVEGGIISEELAAPYLMGGNRNTNIAVLPVGAGTRSVTITPYGGSDCELNPGTASTYSFDFVGPLTAIPGVLGEGDTEELPGGTITVTDAVLDLGTNVVGIMLTGLWLAQGDTIQSAFIQFTAAGTDTAATDVFIRADARGRAPIPSELDSDLTARPTTSASASWSIPSWTDGDSGAAQRTPDIAPIIQEAVDNSGWGQPARLLLLIRDAGTSVGSRRAAASELDPDSRPRLVIQTAP